MILSSPSVIFFDFDGVIVESAPLKAEAFRTLYAPHGAGVVADVMAHHRNHEGISRVEKIRHCHAAFLGIELSDADLAAACQQYSDLVEDAVTACAAVAGSISLLQGLQGRVRSYVASGTPEDELRRITARRGLDPYFDAVYGSPRRKEAIVEGILADLGRKPGECLFIGDAMTDYRAAAASGVPFVGRVAPGHANPFPSGTEIIADMEPLVATLIGG